MCLEFRDQRNHMVNHTVAPTLLLVQIALKWTVRETPHVYVRSEKRIFGLVFGDRVSYWDTHWIPLCHSDPCLRLMRLIIKTSEGGAQLIIVFFSFPFSCLTAPCFSLWVKSKSQIYSKSVCKKWDGRIQQYLTGLMTKSLWTYFCCNKHSTSRQKNFFLHFQK